MQVMNVKLPSVRTKIASKVSTFDGIWLFGGELQSRRAGQGEELREQNKKWKKLGEKKRERDFDE